MTPSFFFTFPIHEDNADSEQSHHGAIDPRSITTIKNSEALTLLRISASISFSLLFELLYVQIARQVGSF